nr:hypothetical protein [Herbaspirillum sp. ASV7]
MSLIKNALEAIRAAFENSFDFANPDDVLRKAEADFRDAVNEEVADLAARVAALEKASQASAPTSSVTLADLAASSGQIVLDNSASASLLPGGVVYVAASASPVVEQVASTAASDASLDQAIAAAAPAPAAE